MDLRYENPSLVYKLIDELGNNKLFSFIYKNYLKELKFKNNEKVLDFGSGSGAGSRHLAEVLKKSQWKFDLRRYFEILDKKGPK